MVWPLPVRIRAHSILKTINILQLEIYSIIIQIVKERLINPSSVIPAQAGIQSIGMPPAENYPVCLYSDEKSGNRCCFTAGFPLARE
jgi:hypothetical protein